MDRVNNGKMDIPSVYIVRENVVRRRQTVSWGSTMVGMLVFVFLASLCLGLVFQLVCDHKQYDNLLAQYNNIVNRGTGMTVTPAMPLVNRAVESGNLSYTYTTTTLTKGTTIYVRPTTTATTFTTASSAAIPGCGTGAPDTVTVTVHDGSSSTSSKRTTRLTTHTIYVTGSDVMTSQQDTVTLTDTSVTVQTTTDAGSIAIGPVSSTSIYISDTASHPVPTHFPNASSSSGFESVSTVNLTVTLPPGGVTATSTGALVTAHSSTTARSDPVGTVVSVSGVRKAAGCSTAMLLVAAVAAVVNF